MVKIVLDILCLLYYNNISLERFTMKKYVKKPWSHEERKLLAKRYHLCTKKELEEVFPDRSYNACVKQAKYLRDRGWVFTKR